MSTDEGRDDYPDSGNPKLSGEFSWAIAWGAIWILFGGLVAYFVFGA